MASPTNILQVIRDVEDDVELEISVDLKLTAEAFRKAVAHGRLRQWTHERDGEWAALVFAAIADGAAIEYDVDDARVIEGPEVLHADR